MSLPKKDFSERDYKSTKSIKIRFPKISSGWLPNNTITDFQWKDYCPAVFRHLQELDKIDSSDYVVSICGHETLRELSSLSSMGKSGSLLYLSQDDRFVIKTICKSEVKVLLTMLPNYCEHIQTHGHSLLNRFYGLHVVRPAGGLKVHFVVMKNILQSDLFIHRRFDLKGSSQGRSLSKVVGDECRTFKDLDLDLSFHLNPLMRYRLLAQIKHDCDFLEAEGVMDYSLLLGIHIEAVKDLTRTQSVSRSTNGRNLASGYSFPQDSSWRNINNQLIDGDDHQNAFRCDIRLGINTPARAVPRNMTGSVAAPYYNVKLHFGIIDILQGYNVAKRIEHAYKSLQFDPRKISSVKPKIYSTRFQEFLAEVFQPDELDFLPSKSTSS